MNRVYALVATAEGMGQAILSALPQVTYLRGEEGEPHPERGRRLVYTRGGEDYELLLLQGQDWRGVDLPPASAASSWLWDMWLLVADSRDNPTGHWRWVAAAQRWLRAQGGAGYVLGPYSLAHALEQWPTEAEALLKDGGEWSFPHLAWDDHAAIVAVDYRPTQTEITEDTDPDPSVLLGT